MRALLQRVNRGSVYVDNNIVGSIGQGLVVFVGIEATDTDRDIEYLVNKIINMRIFSDETGRFNKSLIDLNGSMLIVSQFTLMANVHKGRRPDFTAAAKPEKAETLFNTFVQRVRDMNISVATGRFQAHMTVEIINNGPVTIFLDSKERTGLQS